MSARRWFRRDAASAATSVQAPHQRMTFAPERQLAGMRVAVRASLAATTSRRFR